MQSVAKNLHKPLTEVSFRCVSCGQEWTGAPARVEDDPNRPWHPYAYHAQCSACGSPAKQTPKELGLLKAWANATGPTSDAGRAAAAANLKGHPTPEEAQRTRFNAIKHGLTARTATFFPAKPGKYPHCEGCNYYNAECVEDPPRHHKNPPNCLRRTELFMRHHVAFEAKDPSLLMSLRSDTQAALQAIIDDMILAIVADGGPRVKELKWYHDKDGCFHLAGYKDEDTGEFVQIYELKEHPLLRRLIDFVDRNNLTLADMGMTPKVQDEQDLVRGHLEQQHDTQETLLEYQGKQNKLLEQLAGQIARSRKGIGRDPVLIEHQQSEGEDG
jgi:hypothetical protein